jgi:hypothetical protein
VRRIWNTITTGGLLLFWWLTGGCVAAVPHPAIRCGGDPGCPRGYECRFPGVDTHAVCMPSHSDDVILER